MIRVLPFVVASVLLIGCGAEDDLLVPIKHRPNVVRRLVNTDAATKSIPVDSVKQASESEEVDYVTGIVIWD